MIESDLIHDRRLGSLNPSANKKRRFKTVVFSVIGLVSLLFVLLFSSGRNNLDATLHQFLIRNSSIEVGVVYSVEKHRNWFRERKADLRLAIFEAVIEQGVNGFLLYQEFANTDAGAADASKWLPYSALQLTSRLLFVLLASLPVWIGAFVLGTLVTLLLIGPHEGPDLLGQTGNGRPYYSGIRVALDNIVDDGRPNLHIQGLACLKQSPNRVCKSSRLIELLKQHGAFSKTNQELVSFILAFPEFPAGLTSLNNQNGGPQMETDLVAHTEALLESALVAFSRLKLPSNESTTQADTRSPLGQTINCFQSVVTPNLIQGISSLTPQEIATVVLATQAGKILASENIEGKWVLKSQYPNLSSRAVLHSLPSYSADFDILERQRLRQALIFTAGLSRTNLIRLPKDFPPDSQILRSFSELCFASPSELIEAGTFIEMFNWHSLIHQQFQKAFGDWLQSNLKRLDTGSGWCDNVFLIDLSIMETILAPLLSATEQERFGRLAEINGTKQMESPLQRASSWRMYHPALAAHGWFCERIGAATVPRGGLAKVVINRGPNLADKAKNDLRLQENMVPLRVTTIRQFYGEAWKNRIPLLGGLSVVKDDQEAREIFDGNRSLDVHNFDGFSADQLSTV